MDYFKDKKNKLFVVLFAVMLIVSIAISTTIAVVLFGNA